MKRTVRFVLVLAAAVACGPPEPPELTVFARASSPSGGHQATAYALSGGGAAGYVLYRVALGDPTTDLRHLGPADVAELRHASSLTIAWADDSTLVLQPGPEADVDTVVPRRDGVRVRLAPDGRASQP